jgi:hypothetical protein
MKRKHNLKIPCFCLLLSLLDLPILAQKKVVAELVFDNSVSGVTVKLKAHPSIAGVFDLYGNISLQISTEGKMLIC